MAGASRGLKLVTALLALAVIAESAILILQRIRGDPEAARASSAVLRGQRVARRLGCAGCHGPEGANGIANPGSASGSVPAWVGGTFMMFNESPGEIREWIVDGAPARLAADPDFQKARKQQLIRMPAFRDRAERSELADLVAYVQAVSGAFGPTDDSPAAAGHELAVRFGCFGCHGPEGRGLVANPGSFKAYIPPWDSGDFLELVQGPAEFREWVAEGEIRRLRQNPAAAFFLDRQTIKMPPFKSVLSEADIDKLRAYVDWVRARPTK
jgi:mono/diheme cytochrome c family protein